MTGEAGEDDFALGLVAEVGEHGDELVAAQAGQRVAFAQRVAQALRDDDQQLVAGLVAVRVVHFLESVEIEIDERQQPLAPARLRDGLLQAVGEQHTVGNAGQRVVVRHVLELPLMLLELGDVGEKRNVVLRLVVGVAHGSDVELLGVQLAVLALVPQLAVPVPPGLQVAPHGGVELGAVATGPQHPRTLAEHLLARIAGDPGKGVVDFDDAPRRVGDHDAFVGVRENAGRQFEAGFGGLALGDVGEGKDAADDQLALARRPRLALEHLAAG